MSQQRKAKYEGYINAAKLIDSGKEEFSCIAIERCGGDRSPYIKAFSKSGYGYRFVVEILRASETEDDAVKHRVMMLLFAAQMARTGDL